VVSRKTTLRKAQTVTNLKLESIAWKTVGENMWVLCSAEGKIASKETVKKGDALIKCIQREVGPVPPNRKKVLYEG